MQGRTTSEARGEKVVGPLAPQILTQCTIAVIHCEGSLPHCRLYQRLALVPAHFDPVGFLATIALVAGLRACVRACASECRCCSLFLSSCWSRTQAQ